MRDRERVFRYRKLRYRCVKLEKTDGRPFAETLAKDWLPGVSALVYIAGQPESPKCIQE